MAGPVNQNNDNEGFTAAKGRPIGRELPKSRCKVENTAEANMMNAEWIAGSLKRKNESEEENIAIKVIALAPCDTDDYMQEKAEYLQMMRRRYIRRAQEHDAEDQREERVNRGNISTQGAAARNSLAGQVVLSDSHTHTSDNIGSYKTKQIYFVFVKSTCSYNYFICAVLNQPSRENVLPYRWC